MKYTLTLIALLLATLSFGQAKKDTIEVIAKLLSPGEGDEIHTATYALLAPVKGLEIPDTFRVRYMPLGEPLPDTTFLQLLCENRDTTVRDSFLFPDFDPEKGIKKLQISTISYAYWKKCEEAQFVDGKILDSQCSVPLTRKPGFDRWVLITPCGGIAWVEKNGENDRCPYYLEDFCPMMAHDLTHVPDGEYHGFMMAGELAGMVKIIIRTSKGK